MEEAHFSLEELLTEAPYKHLYSIKDPFVQQLEFSRIDGEAKALGFKMVKSLWSQYLKSMKQSRSLSLITSGNVANFGAGMEDYLFDCGNYVCNEDGIRIYDSNGYETIVCSHPILPVERLVNIDTGDEWLRLAYKKGDSWRFTVVEKTVIASQSAILSLAKCGIIVNSENAKRLSTFLFDIEQMNYERIKETKSVSRLGWVGEHGFSPYVDDLTFDGENNFLHLFNTVKSSGDYDKWKAEMLKLRADKSLGRFALAASFSSVLVEICGINPFFMHFFGGTGNGKTVSLLVAASVWASPRLGDYVTSFNSTPVAQEMMAGFLNSLPLCMDELQIEISLGRNDFDKYIYPLTEGSGKARGSKTGGLQKIQTWRNCIITCGEHDIVTSHSQGGAINRVLSIEFTRQISDSVLELCDIVKENYGFAGKDFVKYLQSDGAIDRVRTLQQDFRRQLIELGGMEKQSAAAAAVLAADAIATELIFKDDNALTVEEIAQYVKTADDISVGKRGYEYINDMLSVNKNRFIDETDHTKPTNDIWGKITPTTIYVVRSIFDRLLLDGGFNPGEVLGWISEKGYLDRIDSHMTKTVYIEGQRPRCVCLKRNADAFDDEYDEDDIE